VREQFLVEVTDTTAQDLSAAGTDHRTALFELNGLLTAWIETEYHRRTTYRDRAIPAGPVGHRMVDAGPDPGDADSTGSDRGVPVVEVPHGDQDRDGVVARNTFQVDAGLVGRKVELVFCPFDMETVEVRYRDNSHGKALPHNITRPFIRKPDPRHPSRPCPRRRGSTT
jgi:hypothetical protein